MASHLPKRWDANFEGMSRQDRRGCDYHAYLAAPLADWSLSISADVAADIADAEAAVRALNDAGTTHVSLEGLARFLLRAESVGSSKIEGLEAAGRRLAQAEAAIALGGDANDRVAVEVIGNIAAMESAVELAANTDRFDLGDLLSVHRTLMDNSPPPNSVASSEKSRIGSAEARSTPAAQPSSRHHLSTSQTCWQTCSTTSTATTTPLSCRPPSPMPSSRPSTPSPTETVAPAAL